MLPSLSSEQRRSAEHGATCGTTPATSAVLSVRIGPVDIDVGSEPDNVVAGRLFKLGKLALFNGMIPEEQAHRCCELRMHAEPCDEFPSELRTTHAWYRSMMNGFRSARMLSPS